MCVYVYIYICMCECVCVYIYIYIYIHIYIYIFLYFHRFLYQILYKMRICSHSAKMACARAEKIGFFKIQNLNFLQKSDFKNIFELKTVYFAYKPISDSLF